MITTVRKIDFNIDGLVKQFYIDINTSEIIRQGDPRLSILACCNEEVTYDCVELCGGNISYLEEISFNIECDLSASTLELSGCVEQINLVILINGEVLFIEQGLPTDVFEGSSTLADINYVDIVQYINSQPSYMLTNQEVSFYYIIEDCLNTTYKTNIITFSHQD